MGYGAPTPFFCDMLLPSNQLLPDPPVENVHGFAHAGYFIKRNSFDANIGEAIIKLTLPPAIRRSLRWRMTLMQVPT